VACAPSLLLFVPRSIGSKTGFAFSPDPISSSGFQPDPARPAIPSRGRRHRVLPTGTLERASRSAAGGLGPPVRAADLEGCGKKSDRQRAARFAFLADSTHDQDQSPKPGASTTCPCRS
jgi:hypothetical protein